MQPVVESAILGDRRLNGILVLPLAVNNVVGSSAISTSLFIPLGGTFALAEVAMTHVTTFDAFGGSDPSQGGAFRAAGFGITQIVSAGQPENLDNVIAVARDQVNSIMVAGFAEPGCAASGKVTISFW